MRPARARSLSLSCRVKKRPDVRAINIHGQFAGRELVSELWISKPLALRYVLCGFNLFSLKFNARVFDVRAPEARTMDPEACLPLDWLSTPRNALYLSMYPIGERKLSRFAVRGGALRFTCAEYEHLWIEFEGSFENYLEKFSSKTRNTLKRKVRKFAELSGGEIVWRIFRAPAELAEFHRLASDVSKKTYQENFLDAGLPSEEQFLKQALPLAEKNSVRAFVLMHSGRPVAYLYCPVEHGTALFYYLGYDPAYRKLSPGTVLLYVALEKCFADGGLRAFDFVEGASDHKRLFATRSERCADIIYVRRSFRSYALFVLYVAINRISGAANMVLRGFGLRTPLKHWQQGAAVRVRATLKRLARLIRNPLLDLRYGAILRGKIPTRFPHLGAVDTENTDYAVLPLMFDGLIRDSDVLVDVGCGKGRVINWWLSRGYRNPIYGIELDPEIAQRTRARLKKVKNVTIITGNALDNIPHDATFFYLYNPFDAPVLRKFKTSLEESFGERRNIRLIYFNSVHVDVFKSDPRWEVKEGHADPGFPTPRDFAFIQFKP